MAHGTTKCYLVYVSEDGKNYTRVFKTYKEKEAYQFRRDYSIKHPEIVSLYIDKVETFKNNKRKDWEE